MDVKSIELELSSWISAAHQLHRVTLEIGGGTCREGWRTCHKSRLNFHRFNFNLSQTDSVQFVSLMLPSPLALLVTGPMKSKIFSFIFKGVTTTVD